MKKPLIIGATAMTLLFGGAGIANAEVTHAPSATTTTVAQGAQDDNDDNGDKGLWGLAGLLGLVGLAGLKRRKDADYPANRGGGTITNNPNNPRI